MASAAAQGTGMRSMTLGVVAAAALAGCAPPEHVVLVHGAFMGAWSWDAVANQLRQAGEQVTVVDLPAHGSDQTPVSGATLDAYVDRVGQAVSAAGEPVVLVGHSMAGMVISQYAEGSPGAVKQLVYFAALLPQDGQSLLDLTSTDTSSLIGPAVAFDQDKGIASLPKDELGTIFCEDCAASGVSALQTNYRDEPIAPLATPAHLTPAGFGSVTKSYLFTSHDQAVTYQLQQRMAAGVALAGTKTLDTSHMPQLAEPQVVTDALESLMIR